MPLDMGSWMGDCFGMMQWPMPGEKYNHALRQIIYENNVKLIIALGIQQKNEPFEMISYWKKLGNRYQELRKGNCIVRKVIGIPPTNGSCTICQYPNWPDYDQPVIDRSDFDYLFSEIQKVEKI